MSKIVSITAHPKFRDVSALRRFLDGEDVCSVGDVSSGDWKMLAELQQWADGLVQLGVEAVSHTPPKRFYAMGTKTNDYKVKPGDGKDDA